MNKNFLLLFPSLRSFSFSQSKRISLVNYRFPMNCKSSWIDSVLTHVRIPSPRLFTRRLWKGSMIFFFLFFFSFVRWILKNYEVEENRNSRVSIFTEFSGPNIVANGLVTVFSYYHDGLYTVEWWLGTDEYWTNDKGLIRAGPNVECIPPSLYTMYIPISIVVYSFSTCFIVRYCRGGGVTIGNERTTRFQGNWTNEKSLN